MIWCSSWKKLAYQVTTYSCPVHLVLFLYSYVRSFVPPFLPTPLPPTLPLILRPFLPPLPSFPEIFSLFLKEAKKILFTLVQYQQNKVLLESRIPTSQLIDWLIDWFLYRFKLSTDPDNAVPVDDLIPELILRAKNDIRVNILPRS